jgi:hypothetical protein
MTLTTEEAGDFPDIIAAAMDELLEADGFGKFAILSSTQEEYIQIGNDWQPDKKCQEFMQTHGSDPWVLEYREAGRQFRADGWITLDQIRVAFRSYLARGSEWRSGFTWRELEL